MNNKRILAMVATISLLAGLLAVGGLLPASAVSDGFTAATVGQYKAWAQATQLSTIMGDATNLILGKTAYGSAYSGGAACGDDDGAASNWYHEADSTHNCNYPGYAGGATDGLIGSHNSRATTEEIFRSNNTSTLRYFYYDLGDVYNVSDFIVASSQCNLAAANRVLKYIDVYVAEEWNETATFTTHKGAFTEGNFTQVFGWSDSASETFIHQIQPANGETVAARYVCFVFKAPVAPNGSAAPIPINELAVYGTEIVEEPVDEWVDGTVGQYKAFDRFTQLSTIMGDKTSLIANKTAYGSPFTSDGKLFFEDNSITNWYNEGTLTGVATQYNGGYNGSQGGATDGQIAASAADCTDTEEIFRSSNTTGFRYFYYDLGATYDISDFVVASTQSTDTKAVLKNFNIYVAETWTAARNVIVTSGAALVGGAPTGFTKVFGYENAASTAYVQRIQPADGTTVTGRYVCFELASPQKSGTTYPIPIGELAVYGEPVDTVKALGGQVAGDYTADADYAQLRMGFNVAVSGVTIDEAYVADYTAAQVTVNGKSYPVATDNDGKALIGTLIARGPLVQSEELVLGTANGDIKMVPAEKVYKCTNTDIIFTTLVRDVPNAYFGEEVVSRAYVGYMDGDTVRYAYGDLLSRSVTGVANNADMG